MDGHNVVAVYRARANAERARERLVESGIPDTDIRMSDGGPFAGTEPLTRDSTVTSAPATGERRGGFWDWLFGRDMPESDRGWYESNLREGRTVLSVLVRNQAERERVGDILDQFDPIEFNGIAGEPISGAETAAPIDGGPLPETGEADIPAGAAGGWTAREQAALDARGQPDARGQLDARGQDEQVIPLVKEELAVGKRASERHYRIRTYIVETPVESDVTLRDERVVVERRPVVGERQVGAADLPREREFEVTERHEEPVVEKRARETEEVVVRREANERTEHVRDTVRETKVDVDDNAAGEPPGTRDTVSPRRNA
jgi:stress response protein YsnF